MGQEPNNPLFQSYGGSYARAYAAAVEADFQENTPVSDEATGDVTGDFTSMLYTPGNSPFFLGILRSEENEGEAQASNGPEAGESAETPARTGMRRKERLIRSLLLILGAEILLIAGLYFSGVL